MPEATKIKLRKYKGKLASGWKGGITDRKKYKRIRRARKYLAEGSHSSSEWEKLKKKCNFTCQICNKKEPDIVLTEDHIIPLSKGGSDFIENIQPFCRSCNSKKRDRITISK